MWMSFLYLVNLVDATGNKHVYNLQHYNNTITDILSIEISL